MKINAGPLRPVLQSGPAVDLVYGVDAAGAYLGVVPAAQAAAIAPGPPPSHGEWRLAASGWAPFRPRGLQALVIEAERDAVIDAGAPWDGRMWYADQMAQQQLAAYLQSFAEGIVPADHLMPVRAKDKAVYQLSRDEIRAVSASVLTLVQQAFAASWVAKAQIQE